MEDDYICLFEHELEEPDLQPFGYTSHIYDDYRKYGIESYFKSNNLPTPYFNKMKTNDFKSLILAVNEGTRLFAERQYELDNVHIKYEDYSPSTHENANSLEEIYSLIDYEDFNIIKFAYYLYFMCNFISIIHARLDTMFRIIFADYRITEKYGYTSFFLLPKNIFDEYDERFCKFLNEYIENIIDNCQRRFKVLETLKENKNDKEFIIKTICFLNENVKYLYLFSRCSKKIAVMCDFIFDLENDLNNGAADIDERFIDDYKKIIGYFKGIDEMMKIKWRNF